MSSFRIIPVIDILDSKAVHAIKGERAKYKPLISKLINSSDPIEIIKVLKQKFNFREFYIADLDAIIKYSPNLQLLSTILKIPEIDLILDPGIKDIEDLLKYSKYNIKKLILGLETINDYNVIYEGLRILGKSKLIVSLDMFKGKIISKIKDLRNQNPINVVNKLKRFGVEELILLDLFRVGQKIGGIPQVYLKILKSFKGAVLVGGGIKDLMDLTSYYNNKFSGVLIATALYDGSIKIDKLKVLK
ncbi:MAG: hypothetical protein EU540_03560 [Promethearchaeota archaeon]|nr:MAG: hypothetical protein EU540_03560 [Candidatus Lokiarchaeota archaeon]